MILAWESTIWLDCIDGGQWMNFGQNAKIYIKNFQRFSHYFCIFDFTIVFVIVFLANRLLSMRNCNWRRTVIASASNCSNGLQQLCVGYFTFPIQFTITFDTLLRFCSNICVHSLDKFIRINNRKQNHFNRGKSLEKKREQTTKEWENE